MSSFAASCFVQIGCMIWTAEGFAFVVMICRPRVATAAAVEDCQIIRIM